MAIKNILITGANGLIGRILQAGLSDCYGIYGLDLDNATAVDSILVADLSDYNQTVEVIRKHLPIDCIIHMAADSKVYASWHSVLRNNIAGTRNIYEAALELGINKVIYASSMHVCLPGDGGPLREPGLTLEAFINNGVKSFPDNDYAMSKMLCEEIARYYHLNYGICSVCLRIGWVSDLERAPKNEAWLDKIRLHSNDLVDVVNRSISANVGYSTCIATSSLTTVLAE